MTRIGLGREYVIFIGEVQGRGADAAVRAPRDWGGDGRWNRMMTGF